MGQRRKKIKKNKKIIINKITWEIKAHEWLAFKNQEVSKWKKTYRKNILIFRGVALIILIIFLFGEPIVAFIMLLFAVLIDYLVNKKVGKLLNNAIDKQIEVTNTFEISFEKTRVRFLDFSFSMSEFLIQTKLQKVNKYNIDCLCFETVDEYIEQSIDGIGGGTSKRIKRFYVPIPEEKTEEEVQQVLSLYEKNKNFTNI